MKRVSIALVALFSVAALPALAADLSARPYTKAPVMAPAPVYNWTGFYIRSHIGGAFQDNNNVFGWQQ
jgi:outer membrane immunogenic protein